MTEITVSAEQAIKALREVVAETGENYVYVNDNGDSPTWDYVAGEMAGAVTCTYVHDIHYDAAGKFLSGTPGCIVGKALAKLGFQLGDLVRYNSMSAGILNEKPEFHGISERVVDLFVTAQRIQDTGRTYGVALKSAEQQMERWGLLN